MSKRIAKQIQNFTAIFEVKSRIHFQNIVNIFFFFVRENSCFNVKRRSFLERI